MVHKTYIRIRSVHVLKNRVEFASTDTSSSEHSPGRLELLFASGRITHEGRVAPNETYGATKELNWKAE